MHVEFDTPFDQRYPLYTRCNASEVFPEVLTPLAWSLLGRSVERGFRTSYCEHLGVIPDIDQPWLTIGRFAGRLHLNLSVIRTVAERMPGMSAASNDRNFFGAVLARGLPEHETDPDDARWLRRGLPASVRTMSMASRWVRAQAVSVQAEVARTDGFLALQPSCAVLVSRLDELRGQRYQDLFGLHMTVRALTSAPTTMAQHALVRRGLSVAAAMDVISSVPDLESAKPSRALAAIARTVPVGSPLAHALAERISWAQLRVSPLPGAGTLSRGLETFIGEFGHRGVNEFDPTVPVWEQAPDRVLTLLRPLLTERDVAPPQSARRRSGVIAGALVHSARNAMHRGELSKNSITLFTHQIRKVLFALAGRFADRLSLDDLQMLTLEEIRAVANGARVPEDLIGRRRAEVQAARSVEPSVWSYRTLALAPPPVITGAEVIAGVGGSAGVVRGRVRVLFDPYEDIAEGEILVAKITDTAWTPLFLTAVAVVTDIGGLLSHATIVARDLGIPAVVDTKNATSELYDGDLVEVDGSAGTVRVLERNR